MRPALAAVSGVLAFAAAWELAGLGLPVMGRRVASRLRRRVVDDDGSARLSRWLGIAARLRRAGLEGTISPRAFLVAKGAGVVAGGLCAAAAVPVMPGRLAPAIVALLVVAGFLGPDAWAERSARIRTARLLAALPDALDLLAVGAATGRSPAILFSELATGTAGPLAAELAVTVAELQCGVSQAAALDSLRRRTGVSQVGALAAALERSRQYGSPLAVQLHAQAASLRSEERRRIEERAARAAPKIQLVVALVLVPSALLTIAAALIANSHLLFGAL